MSEVNIWANSCRELRFKYIFPFHIGSKYERCSVLTQHIALGIIADSNDNLEVYIFIRFICYLVIFALIET